MGPNRNVPRQMLPNMRMQGPGMPAYNLSQAGMGVMNPGGMPMQRGVAPPQPQAHQQHQVIILRN